MSKPILDELAIYPIKSIQGIKLTESFVHLDGLAGDRRYMLVDEEGKFITARKHHRLCLIQAVQLAGGRLALSSPDHVTSLTLDPAEFDAQYIPVTVWKSTVQGQRCKPEQDEWFSKILGEPVRLIYFGQESKRMTSRRPDQPVAFADGYPFLIASRASLSSLAHRCPEPVSMERFRPNIVVDQCDPFAEDGWQTIRIGEVIFEAVKPCVRCLFTTLNPDTAERSRKGEPLKTLAKFRLLEKEGATFAMNFVARNEGKILVGDTIEVLETRIPESYQDRALAQS